MTEKEYRALPIDSYSSFKDFLEGRKKYYKKHVLGEREEEEDDKATLIGNVVDSMYANGDEGIEGRYYLSSGYDKPTGLMLEFTENLYKVVNENPEKEILENLQEAYNRSSFKRDKFETILAKFQGSDSEKYFDEILAVRPNGLTVLVEQDLKNAQKVLDDFYTHPNTSSIMRMKTTEKVEIQKQVPVIFQINGYDVKGLLDRREINHEEKFIQPDDVKVTWNVDEFLEKYFLFRRSDIQAAIYYLGTLDWRDRNYPDYEVRPMRFLVADSIGYNAPLVYTTDQRDVLKGLNGFEYKGKKFKGLYEIIEDLRWHKENDLWNVSRENFQNKGIIKIGEKLWGLETV